MWGGAVSVVRPMLLVRNPVEEFTASSSRKGGFALSGIANSAGICNDAG